MGVADQPYGPGQRPDKFGLKFGEGGAQRPLHQPTSNQRMLAVRAGDDQRANEGQEAGRNYHGGTSVLYEFKRLKNIVGAYGQAMEVSVPGGMKLFVSYNTIVGFFSELLREKDDRESVLPDSERGHRWRVNIWGHATGAHLKNWGSQETYRMDANVFFRMFDRAHEDMVLKLSRETRGMALRDRAAVYEAIEALEPVDVSGGSYVSLESAREAHAAVEAAKVALKRVIEQFEE